MSKLALVLLAAAATAALLPAQRRTWVVDRAGGAGSHFTEIQPAIDAASPGDRVEVRYSLLRYRAFVLTKGLDLEGTSPIPVPVLPAEVRDVPAGQATQVSLLAFGDGSQGNQGLRALIVSRCRGPVLLASVSAAGALDVTDCDQLLILDSTLTPGVQNIGALVTNSRVTLQRSMLRGGTGFSNLYGTGGSGGPALEAVNSSVFAVATQFVGGGGGDGRCSWSGNGGDGGPAIRTDGPILLISGCRCAAGLGAPAPSPCQPGRDGPALLATGTAARVTSDVVLQGATTNVTIIPPLPWIHSPALATRGAPATLTFNGAPSTLIMLYMDREHGHLPLPGIDGPFLLTTRAIALPLLTIGGSGTTPLTLPVPMDPALANAFVFFQGVAFVPAGPVPSLTNLGDLRIR